MAHSQVAVHRGHSGSRFPIVVAAAVATGLEGIIALIVAQRSLSVSEFVPLGQLWTIWAVTAAAITYAFQQWSATHDVHVADIVRTAAGRRLLAALIAVSVVVFAASSVARTRLFSVETWWWPVFAAVIPFGTAATGMTRGVLARRNARGRLAVVIAGENAIRLGCTIALAGLGARNEWFGVALLAGFLIALVPTHDRAPRLPEQPLPPTSQLYAAAVVGLCSHVFLFGSPIALALAGGAPADVASLFLVLTSVRAPFILLQGITPQFAASIGRDTTRTQRKGLQRAILITVVAGAAGAFAIGFLFGDPIVGRVFEILGDVDPNVYGLVAAASVISACMLLTTVAIVADGGLRRLGAAWSVPIAGTVVLTATHRLDTLPVMAAWLLIGHCIVAAWLIPALRPRRRYT